MLTYQHLHLFFFSSRRRHTILQGDWSSDVCSSDLSSIGMSPSGGHQLYVSPRSPPSTNLPRPPWPSIANVPVAGSRSEERRVGKEGRGWSSTHTFNDERSN